MNLSLIHEEMRPGPVCGPGLFSAARTIKDFFPFRKRNFDFTGIGILGR